MLITMDDFLVGWGVKKQESVEAVEVRTYGGKEYTLLEAVQHNNHTHTHHTHITNTHHTITYLHMLLLCDNNCQIAHSTALHHGN